MKYEKLYKLINEAAKESLGEDAIIVRDDNSLKLLNDIIFSSLEKTEKFHKSLIRAIRSILYVKTNNVHFEEILNKIKKQKKFDWCVINEKDSIAIVNKNKFKKQKDMIVKYYFLYENYHEIYYVETEEETVKKIYDLYRRDFKYKDYINYKGGYKYGKIH